MYGFPEKSDFSENHSFYPFPLGFRLRQKELSYGFPQSKGGFIANTYKSGEFQCRVYLRGATGVMWDVGGLSRASEIFLETFPDTSKKSIYLNTSDDEQIRRIDFIASGGIQQFIEDINIEELVQRFPLEAFFLWGNSGNKIRGGLNLKSSNLVQLDVRGATFDSSVNLLNLPSSLTYLFLAWMSIDEGFPDFSAFSFTHLNLVGCRLSGVVPQEYMPSNCPTLRLDQNSLSGTLPIPPVDCVYYNVSSNNFTGTLIPLWEGVRVFYAGANQLTGNIPALALIGSLADFQVSRNQLTGNIPSLPSALRTIDVRFNQLTGNIPSLPSACVNVFVSGNQLTGDIPVLHPGVAQVRAESNQFTAFADSNFPLNSSIFYLQFNNNLIETIPDLLNATNIETVLGYNNAISSIPTGSLVTLFKLKTMQLQNNLLPQIEVDRILEEIWANEQNRNPKISGCILNVGGTGNAAPSVTGVVARDNLIASGNWTVTTN